MCTEEESRHFTATYVANVKERLKEPSDELDHTHRSILEAEIKSMEEGVQRLWESQTVEERLERLNNPAQSY